MHSFILLVNNGKPECNFTHFFRDKLSLSVQNVSLKLPERYSNGSDRQRMTDLAKFITDSARTGNHKMTIFAAYYILYYI